MLRFIKKLFSGTIEAGSAAEKRMIITSIAVAAVVLICDIVTKLLVINYFKLHESVSVIEGILNWTYIRNPGAAWGMFAGYTWLLLAVSFCVFGLIIRFYRYLTEGFSERFVAMALVISGIIGNSIDRLWHGEVIDFIDVHYYNVWHYPVFNVADIAICTGVAIFVLSNTFRKSRKEEQK